MDDEMKKFMLLVESYINSQPDDVFEEETEVVESFSDNFDLLISDIIEFKEKLLDTSSNTGNKEFDEGYDTAVYQIVEKLENLLKLQYNRTI